MRIAIVMLAGLLMIQLVPAQTLTPVQRFADIFAAVLRASR